MTLSQHTEEDTTHLFHYTLSGEREKKEKKEEKD